MIPLALVLYRLLPSNTRTLGLIAALIGIGGMLVAAYGQSLLVFGKIDFEGSMKYFPCGGSHRDLVDSDQLLCPEKRPVPRWAGLERVSWQVSVTS